MPCIGCKKRMSEPKGLYWMKFVGRPDGVLMKHAPGNFIHGEKYKVPYNHAQWKFWELLEEAPVLVAPEPSEEDSVFEEDVFIPEEEPAMEITSSLSADEISMTSSAGYEGDAIIDPDAPAIIEPYMMYNTGTGELTEAPEEIFEETPEVSEALMLKSEIARLTAALEDAKTTPSVKLEEVLAEPNRGDLLKILKEAGVEVKPRTRTTTLQKMVDDLGS